MSLLAVSSYDPATVVEKPVNAALAMTALDTTNLRNTFKAPANGKVMVRLKGQIHGGAYPRLLFGVLEGSTLKGRGSPIGSFVVASSNVILGQECIYTVEGLTSGTEYTWDAAYGVEVIAGTVEVPTTTLKYGGPNNAVGQDAFGPFIFEVWEVSNLLKGIFYDPTTSVSKAVATAAMAAIDTTNLRAKFTAPASGKVMWRITGQLAGSTATTSILLGILESTTVKSRCAPTQGNPTANSITSCSVVEATNIVTGLTSGTEYTWDASYSVETTSGSTFKYGGPNNTTVNDSFGGVSFEIWIV